MSKNIKVKLLSPFAKLPNRQTVGSAGYDIYSAESVKIKPGEQKIISTGIVIQLPDCPIENHIYAFEIISRSGLCAKYYIDKKAGLIDSDYTGEIKVILHNYVNKDTSKVQPHLLEDYVVNIGDRIAQGIVIMVATYPIIEVTDISETVRGSGGFGSTGI